jgi:hypothetical protein
VCLHLGHVLVELHLLIGVQHGANRCDVLVAPLLHLRAAGAHAGRVATLTGRTGVATALGALGLPLLPLAVAQRLDLGLLIGAEGDAAEQHRLRPAATTRSAPDAAFLLRVARTIRAAGTLSARDAGGAECEGKGEGRDDRVVSHRRLLK